MKQKGFSILMIIIIICLLAGLVIAGMYLFKKQNIISVPNYNNSMTQTDPNEELSADLEAIQISDIESDFTALDRDLESL